MKPYYTNYIRIPFNKACFYNLIITVEDYSLIRHLQNILLS